MPHFLDSTNISAPFAQKPLTRVTASCYTRFGDVFGKISAENEQSGISSDTLRYYEPGLLPPVNRNDCSIRDYRELDVRRVEFIKFRRNAGLTIETLIEYYNLVQQGDPGMACGKECTSLEQ